MNELKGKINVWMNKWVYLEVHIPVEELGVQEQSDTVVVEHLHWWEQTELERFGEPDQRKKNII